ncbi:hypothetical protein NDU88_005648 [Pleurodeles waltl]|uniref:Integrase SAM-like N-terminal domain-containing protein n=1 Tax=Pleurodeles waltl TaxID=8319 RepID=A0AAV7PGJ6_PLEWA|nr:hypothetical protein NDU88_005648 [Pleurodeles waltl]
MVRRVQEWEVANKSVFRAGEQVEFVDEQGEVLRGTISGVTRDDGRSGSAQVRLDFWQQGARAYLSGCNKAHVHERHGLASECQRFGRPADFSVPVEVRAPPAHRFEERAQSGAVRPTARGTSVPDIESLDPFLRENRVIPASRSASTGLVPEEEELDYEDEAPVVDVRAVSAPKTVSSGQAFQGDRLSLRREVVGGLRRVAEIPWAGTGSRCAKDGGSQGVMGTRRVRMLELVQQSIAPSTRRSYEQAWLEFLQSGAVKREGGFEVCEMRREDAIHFIMQQIELGLSAVTISGLKGQEGILQSDVQVVSGDLMGAVPSG